jgi:hypothetical protein
MVISTSSGNVHGAVEFGRGSPASDGCYAPAFDDQSHRADSMGGRSDGGSPAVSAGPTLYVDAA